jgi:hypothetical protein
MHWLDPDFLPATKGKVKQFLINPKGDVDGFLFSDGREVHFPPHMSEAVLESLKVGDKVIVRGAKPRDADLIAAVAIDFGEGRRIEDFGPPDEESDNAKNHQKKPHHQDMQHSGTILRALHAPKGELRGVAFKDGVSARFPKHEAEKIRHLIKPDAPLAVRGKALVTEFGTVIDVKEAGASLAELKPLKNAHPKEKHLEEKADA